MAVDPIHQFEIQKLATVATIGGTEIHFTNSALFMLISVGLTIAAAARHHGRPPAGARRGCSRSANSPTNSSPT